MADIGSTLSKYVSSSEISSLVESDKVGIYLADSYLALDGITDDYSSLYSLINTTINGVEAEIWFKSGTCYIGASITIPSNIKLVFLNGAKLQPQLGVVITGSDSQIKSDISQIFDFSVSGYTGIAGTWNVGDIYPQWFGAVGDGTTDDSIPIKSAFQMLRSQGGGKIYFPYTPQSYIVTEDIFIPSNTTVEMHGFIKRSGAATGFDAVLIGDVGSENITLINPLVDCDNQSGMNAIIIRRDNINFKIFGGHLKNGSHDKDGRYGGRGINVEAGFDTTTYAQKGTIINGVKIESFYMGLGLQGGDTQEQNNCIISNITMFGCEVMVGLFGNTEGYPHDGQAMSFILSNITGKNCGNSTTYARKHGLISSDRGSNVIINNFYCYNEASVGSIGAVMFGLFHNVTVKNCVFDGDSDFILTGYNYQERDSILDLGFGNSDLNIEITHNGTITDVFALSSSTTSKFVSSELKFRTNIVTNNRPIVSQISSNTGVKLDIYNKANNSRFIGLAIDLSTGFLFSNAQDQINFGKKLNIKDANGTTRTITCATDNDLLINGIVVGTQT